MWARETAFILQEESEETHQEPVGMVGALQRERHDTCLSVLSTLLANKFARPGVQLEADVHLPIEAGNIKRLLTSSL